MYLNMKLILLNNADNNLYKLQILVKTKISIKLLPSQLSDLQGISASTAIKR